MNVTVDCDGARHTLVVDEDDGTLRMADHDPESEQILAAMGAATPFCIRAVDAWRNFQPSEPRHLIAIADPDLLSERGREQIRRQVEYAEAHVEVMARQRTRSTELWARQREKALPNERVSAMLRLPADLRREWLRRTLADAEATWTDPADDAEPTPVELLLMLAAERELARLGGRADKKLWWRSIAPDAEPAILGEAAPGVKIVGVPIRWLRERWLTGDTTADGRLLLIPGVTLDFEESGSPVLRRA